MAWTYSTYAGTYAIGENGSIKYGMFELSRAINERQGYVGITKTQWYKADGTQAADIAITDLVGLQIASANYKTNIDRIYTAIRAMASSFKVSGTSLTAYSTGTLETAIGATLTPTLSNVNIFQAALFQVAQDALDLLLYISEAEGLDGSTVSDDVTEYWSGSWRAGVVDNPTGDLDTDQDAWDQITNYTQTITDGKDFELTISKYDDGAFPNNGIEYEATRRLGSQNVEIDFSAYGYTGTAASTWYRVDWNNEFDVDCDWAFGGASGVALANDAESLVYTQGTAIAVDTLVTKSLTAEFSSGASPPAGTYATPSALDLIVSPKQCVCVIDLTPYLTDQA